MLGPAFPEDCAVPLASFLPSLRSKIWSVEDRTDLRLHVGLAAGILCFVIVAVLAFGAASVGRREAIGIASANLNAMAATFSDRLDRNIVYRFGAVADLASLEPLRDIWTGPPVVIRKVLEQTRSNFEGAPWLGYATADGIVKAAAGHVHEGMSVADEPWFRHGLVAPSAEDSSGREPFEPDGSASGAEAGARRFIDLGVPVRNCAGTVIGVLGLHISRIWAEHLGKSTVRSSPAIALGIIRSDGRTILGDPTLDPVPPEDRVDVVLVGGGKRPDVDSTGYLSGFAATRGSSVGLGWLIVARQPAASALATADKVVSTIVALGLLVGFGGIVGSLLIAAHVSNPFRTLADGAERIGPDTVDRLPRVRGSREAVGLSIALRSLLLRVGSAERSRAEDRDRATHETQKLSLDLAILRTLADIDTLTDLLNRRAFMERAKLAMEMFRREQRSCVVLMIDIDHFKRVNDIWGHAAGDAVLRAVASRISKAIRPSDIAGRFGGEEFVVLLREADMSDGMQVAERVRGFVSEGPIDCNSARVAVTVSVGVAVASPEDRDIQAVIEHADIALYAAKDAGRNRVAVAPASAQRKARTA